VVIIGTKAPSSNEAVLEVTGEILVKSLLTEGEESASLTVQPPSSSNLTIFDALLSGMFQGRILREHQNFQLSMIQTH